MGDDHEAIRYDTHFLYSVSAWGGHIYGVWPCLMPEFEPIRKTRLITARIFKNTRLVILLDSKQHVLEISEYKCSSEILMRIDALSTRVIDKLSIPLIVRSTEVQYFILRTTYNSSSSQ